MTRKRSGSLREKNANPGVEDTVLVFITGIRDYVFDAFDLYAFQYLLKPIDEDKFAEVLERAVREAAKKKERCVLFIKSRNLTLDQSEILYIESRAKKVEIHTKGAAQVIEIYAAMDELEGQLGENFIASPGSCRPLSKEEVVEIIMKCK